MTVTLTPIDARRACVGHDTELFFADHPDAVAEAKAVCGSCLIRSECLDAALRRAEPFGVWGGMTAKERHALALRTGARGGTAARHNLNADAVVAYVKRAKTMTAAAARYGVHAKVIRQILDEAGEDGRQVRQERKHFSDVPAAQIAQEYAAGSSLHKLADKFHTSTKIVRRAVLSEGGTIRPRSIGRRPTINGERVSR